jgi:hypothetical protein
VPLLLLWLASALELALLVGLLARRRLAYCHTLAPCVAAWLASDLAVALWPNCNTWTFWVMKEAIHAVLAFAVGVELSLRLLAVAPLGQLATQRWLAICVSLAVALVITAAHGQMVILARVLAAQSWLYLGLALVAARYWIPLGRLHGTLLLAVSPYFLLCWLTWTRSGDDTAVASLVNAAAFVVVLAVLAWAAWTDDPAPPVEPGLVRLVWPWTR